MVVSALLSRVREQGGAGKDYSYGADVRQYSFTVRRYQLTCFDRLSRWQLSGRQMQGKGSALMGS